MRNLIPHFIQEKYQQDITAGDFRALTMFVDVSGFTPMTQTLMKHGHVGAEILATVLNRLFDLLVDAVYEHGGFISVFAGDAFTAIFPISDELPAEKLILHILACVGKIQTISRHHGIQTTPFGQFALQFKAGLSGGMVNWGIVGKTAKTYFFRGLAIDGCAAVEHLADKGDVIFDEHLAQAIRNVPHIAKNIGNISLVQKGYYRLPEIPKALTQHVPPLKLPRRKPLQKQVAACFLSDAIITFNAIGEFRQVVPIFIAFEGITTLAELDDWAFVLIEHLKTFGGYINNFDFGDKGNTVFCGFGAPIAYENTVERAVNFIVAVKESVNAVATLANLKFRAGITYGTVYAGIAGGTKRCVYTYYGDAVNLAARLMMAASWGEIFVSTEVAQKSEQIDYEFKGHAPYKGFAAPVATYLLRGRKTLLTRKAFTDDMFGRQAELQRLQEFATPILDGKFAGIAYIFGEAGIGKSRLAYALRETLEQQAHILWFDCPAEQILRKPFNPFRTWLARYFGQASEHSEAENKTTFEDAYQRLIEQCQALHNASAAVDDHLKELIRTKTIIGAQIGLFWRDSLWEQLDAKGKYENTLAALKNFLLIQSLCHSVVIELEDGHWLDPDSLAVLKNLTRPIPDYPVLLIATIRYNDDGSKTTFQLEDVRECQIELNYLTAEEVRQYAVTKLQGDVSVELRDRLFEKTNGNPFFVQQLLRYFVENNFVTVQAGTWYLSAGSRELPDTINAVVMARIDRLADKVKEVVKAAAVIGREFEVLLLSAILQKEVLPEIQIARNVQIWDEVHELAYMFRHALLRDAAYEMQLKARLRELHQSTAEAMETLDAPRAPQRYADLAFHYEKAEIRDKAIEYLQKAGDEAKSQYLNRPALAFYDRLLEQSRNVFSLTEVVIDTLLKKAEILELTGKWPECQQVSAEAFDLAEEVDDQRRMGQAKRLIGLMGQETAQYDMAVICFQEAIALYEAINEHAGIAEVLTSMGVVYQRKWETEAALSCYEKALKISEQIGNSLRMIKIMNNIGSLYEDVKGDSIQAMTWFQNSLELTRKLGEKLECSKILNNIGECYRTQGDYDNAMRHYEQALIIHGELGNKRSMSIVLGNIGHVLRAKGNYSEALPSYDKAIALARELGNRYYLCGSLIGKADALFALQRYAEAQTFSTEGLHIAQDISKKDSTLMGTILLAKIDVRLGHAGAVQRLEDMLQHTQNETELAALHYELWQINQDDKHRQTALSLYQTLSVRTLNSEYKKRMKELQ